MSDEVETRRALLFALAATLLWSTVATAFKVALRYVTVIQLVALASLVSTALLGGILLVRGTLRGVFRRSGATWRRALVRGTLNPTAYYLVLFEAYARLPAQVAQPLNYSWTLALSLLAVPLLGHRLRARDLAGVLLGYVGVVVVSIAGRRTMGVLDATGVLFALISAVLWATYWILSVREKDDPVEALFQSFLVATPALLVGMGWLDGVPRLGDVRAWASVSYVGAFEMGITFVLWQAALRAGRRMTQVTSIVFLSPFMSLVLIHSVLGEPLHSLTFVGLGLIAGGVALSRMPAPEQEGARSK